MINLTHRHVENSEDTFSRDRESNFNEWLRQMFNDPDFVRLTLEFEEETITWEKESKIRGV